VGIHHVGIAVRDLEASARFYRDGLGFTVLMEQTFDKDWKRLVDSPCSRMHAVILARPDHPGSAIELIAFEDGIARTPRSGPPTGIFLMAFEIADVEAAKARLSALGFGDFEQEHSDIGGHRLHVTFVRDPDGNVVELVAAAEVRAANL
jgi:catechol 2,3-dioxygenase-like lactoylglutathione lyase family enzyme